MTRENYGPVAHIIHSADPSCLNHVWELDAETRATLFNLITDYLKHLEIHLNQITDVLNTFTKRIGYLAKI
jgi:6-pyruvoyl-tetrahydropterin synthase